MYDMCKMQSLVRTLMLVIVVLFIVFLPYGKGIIISMKYPNIN